MNKKPPPQVLFNFEEDNDHIEEAQPPQESGLKLELQSDAEEDFESYEDELVKIQERENRMKMIYLRISLRQ